MPVNHPVFPLPDNRQQFSMRTKEEGIYKRSFWCVVEKLIQNLRQTA
jgi:hypothetical protein